MNDQLQSWPTPEIFVKGNSAIPPTSDTRITEASDTRITEAGDTRVTE